MYHHRCWSIDRTFLFVDSREARALWCTFILAFPELLALCLMPDHLHLLLPHADPDGRIAVAESAFARWRNHHRGEKGRVFAQQPPMRLVPEREEGRVVRYTHLNPCRRRLVDDPLAWPWSTHRDRVGLTLEPIGPVAPDPARFHGYVSRDRDVRPEGTPLPTPRAPTLAGVTDGICAMARCNPEDLRRRGVARSLFVRVAWTAGLRDSHEIARRTELGRTAIWRLVRELGGAPDRRIAAGLAVAGDPRFRGIATPMP
jgi:hypothetical protein